jgi:hypothetical protein
MSLLPPRLQANCHELKASDLFRRPNSSLRQLSSCIATPKHIRHSATSILIVVISWSAFHFSSLLYVSSWRPYHSRWATAQCPTSPRLRLCHHHLESSQTSSIPFRALLWPWPCPPPCLHCPSRLSSAASMPASLSSTRSGGMTGLASLDGSSPQNTPSTRWSSSPSREWGPICGIFQAPSSLTRSLAW